MVRVWMEPSATKKELPNKDLRKGDVLLKESGGSGWSKMVHSVLAAAVRCAEICIQQTLIPY